MLDETKTPKGPLEREVRRVILGDYFTHDSTGRRWVVDAITARLKPGTCKTVIILELRSEDA